MELRHMDLVVIQGPQGAVGEALVVKIKVLGFQVEGFQAQSVHREALGDGLRRSRPSQPPAPDIRKDGSEGCHQASRRDGPAVGGLLNGQPIGHHGKLRSFAGRVRHGREG